MGLGPVPDSNLASQRFFTGNCPFPFPSLPFPRILVYPELLVWLMVCQDFPFGAQLSLIPEARGHLCSARPPSPRHRPRPGSKHTQASAPRGFWLPGWPLPAALCPAAPLSSKNIPPGSVHPWPLAREL